MMQKERKTKKDEGPKTVKPRGKKCEKNIGVFEIVRII